MTPKLFFGMLQPKSTIKYWFLVILFHKTLNFLKLDSIIPYYSATIHHKLNPWVVHWTLPQTFLLNTYCDLNSVIHKNIYLTELALLCRENCKYFKYTYRTQDNRIYNYCWLHVISWNIVYKLIINISKHNVSEK